MPYILIGEPCYNMYADKLAAYGFVPIALPASEHLNKTVASHADTLIYSDGTVHIINSDYLTKLPKNIHDRFSPVPEAPNGSYPRDAAFNALRIGRFLFARFASIAPSVRSAAHEAYLTEVNVNQGYAKCSTLALTGAHAAITADEGMARVMESVGIEVLRITPGHIRLEGCEYGFIGGASFVWEPKNCCSISRFGRYVYFFGDIRRHPDGGRIAEFVEKHGYEVISSDGILTDFGGAVVLE